MIQTILIVDEQIAVRQLLQQALQKIGYHTSVVDNAQQALDFISQNKPNVMIVDDELDNMSGGQLCRQIKHNSATQDIPIVMHSRGLRVTNPEYLRATGADATLLKPVSIDSVLSAVESVLQLIPV